MAELEANNAELTRRNKDLQERLELKENMVFEAGVYWRVIGGEKVGPFCPRCFDEHGAAIRLLDRQGFTQWVCPECNILMSKHKGEMVWRG